MYVKYDGVSTYVTLIVNKIGADTKSVVRVMDLAAQGERNS